MPWAISPVRAPEAFPLRAIELRMLLLVLRHLGGYLSPAHLRDLLKAAIAADDPFAGIGVAGFGAASCVEAQDMHVLMLAIGFSEVLQLAAVQADGIFEIGRFKRFHVEVGGACFAEDSGAFH